MNSVLPREYYQRDTVIVSKGLLGKFLVRVIDGKRLVGKIVETEAYLPFDDPAAHNYIGKTTRNAVQFGEGGFTYVHSMHQVHCMDIVAETVDVPGSVLIRALEPIEGIELMMENRHTKNVQNLTNGPGKLCQALQITRELNGVDVTDEESMIIVEDGELIVEGRILTSKRVGISKAKDLPLRFSIKGNVFVSKS